MKEGETAWRHSLFIIVLRFLSTAPGNFGAILSTKERPVGYYPVTMETLNLLLRLIHGISVVEDTDSQPISFLDLAACLVFVMREVFTGFHKWRFTGLKDREEIGMIVMHQTGFACIGLLLYVIYFGIVHYC